MEKFLEQYNRMKRWQKRLEEIHSGRKHTRETDSYQDVVYAFFQNCFHLKDWVIKSGVLSAQKVEEFMKQTVEMRICRDLSNSAKHLVIGDNYPAAIDKNIQVKNRKFSLELGGAETLISVDYSVEADGQIYQAFDVAIICVNLWEKFLKENKLLS